MGDDLARMKIACVLHGKVIVANCGGGPALTGEIRGVYRQYCHLQHECLKKRQSWASH